MYLFTWSLNLLTSYENFHVVGNHINIHYTQLIYKVLRSELYVEVYQRESLVAIIFFFSVAQQSNCGLDCLSFEVSRSHSPGRTSLNV